MPRSGKDMVVLKELLEPRLHVLKLQFSIDHEHSGPALTVESLVVGQDRLSLTMEGHQPFRNNLLSIVKPAAGLAAIQQPLSHHLIPGLDIGKQNDSDLLPNDLLPDIDVLLVAGKAVDHHRPALADLQNLLLQLLHHDPTGHHLPLLHLLTDLLRLLRPRLQVLPQDVAHREVQQTETLPQQVAVSPLPRSRPSKHEDHFRLVTHRNIIVASQNQHLNSPPPLILLAGQSIRNI